MKELSSALVMLLMTAGALWTVPAGAEERGSPDNADSEPNDDFAGATLVAPGAGNTVTISGTTSPSDVNDYYKIRLNQTGGNADYLNVTTSDSSNAAIRLFLYDPLGKEILLDGDPNFLTSHTVDTLAAYTGDYFVRYEGQVFGSGPESYSITFTKSVRPYTGDANGTTATAVAISSSPMLFQGTLEDPTDQADWYYIDLVSDAQTATVVTFSATPSASLAIFAEVYLPNMSYLVTAASTYHFDPLQPGFPPEGMKSEGSFGAVVGGRYFIRILCVDGSGTYSLSSSFRAIPRDGYNSAETAMGLPDLSERHYLDFEDTLGLEVDVHDYYSFPVVEGQIVNATLWSLDYNATLDSPQLNMVLRDSNNQTYGTTTGIAKNATHADGIAQETTTQSLLHVQLMTATGGAGAYRVNLTVNTRPAILEGTWETDFTINESSFGVLDLSTIFYDQDDDPLTFTHVNNGVGKTMLKVTGTSAEFSTLQPGWVGTENYTITAEDPFGYTAEANVHVEVVPVNHPPYVRDWTMPDLTMAAGEIKDRGLNLTDFFYDDDIDNPAIYDHLLYHVKDAGPLDIRFELIKGTLYHSGTVIIWAKGLDDLTSPVTYTPSFWATDHVNLSTPELTCNITVNPPVNHPPRWSSNFTLLEMNESRPEAVTEVVVDLARYCTDTDPWDRGNLTFSAKDYSTNFVVSITSGTARISPRTGFWTEEPHERVTFTATDTKLLSNDTTVRLVVHHVYQPPAFTGSIPLISPVEISEGEVAAFMVAVRMDPLIANLTPQPIKFKWTLNGTQVASWDNYTYRSDHTSASRSPFNVTVTFNDSMSEISKSWKLVVKNVNQPPGNVKIISPGNNTNWSSGKKLDFRAQLASDPDDPAAELTYKWTDNGVTFGNTQSFTSSKLSVGTHRIVLTVTDPDGDSTEDVISIRIKAKSEPKGCFALYLVLLPIPLVGLLSYGLRTRKD